MILGVAAHRDEVLARRAEGEGVDRVLVLARERFTDLWHDTLHALHTCEYWCWRESGLQTCGTIRYIRYIRASTGAGARAVYRPGMVATLSYPRP